MFEMRWKSQKNMFMEHHDIAVLPFNDIKQRTLQSVAKSIWHMYNRLTIRTLERSSRRIEGLMCSTAEDTIHHIETKKNWMRVLYNMRRFSARNVSNRTKENKSAEPSKMVYFYVKLKKKSRKLELHVLLMVFSGSKRAHSQNTWILLRELKVDL